MQPKGIVAGLGELTGAGLRPAEYAARLLQQDGSGLWPKIGTGKRVMINVPEMINLWTVLVLGFGRTSDGPRLVKEFLQLQAQRVMLHHVVGGQPQTSDMSVLLAGAPSLAEMLAHWLSNLIHPDEEVHAMADAERQNPTIRIMLTNPLTAELVLPAADDSGSFEHYSFSVLGKDVEAEQPSKVHRLEVVLGLKELRAFAAMARGAYSPTETPSAGTSTSPGRDEEKAIPETMKATGPGSHSGLPVEQPAPKAQTAPLNKAQSATSTGSKQLQPDPVVPRSRARSPTRSRKDQP